jgi:hypothetical protein
MFHMAVIRFMSSGLNGTESRCNGAVFSTPETALDAILSEELIGTTRDGKSQFCTRFWTNRAYRELLKDRIDGMFQAAERGFYAWNKVNVRLNPQDDKNPVVCEILMFMY